MRYQFIQPNNRIVNSTPFGRRLKRFLRKPEQKALLPDGASWRYVGSWMLADALVKWSGRQLTMSSLRNPDGSIGHVVATVPDASAFIDADGVAGELDLMTKMAVIMHAPHAALDDFDANAATQAGLPYQEEVAMEMAVRLLHRFGRYRPDLFAPARQRATVEGIVVS